MPFLLKAVVLLFAGCIAGIINSVAGGGTLISFPALMFAGAPAVQANATNALALMPGLVGSLWAYKSEIAAQRRWAWRFAPASLIGGLLGGVILIQTGEGHFRALVPYLILFAATLFTFRGSVARWLEIEAHSIEQSRHGLAVAILFQFLVAVYGGYFGAGIGILMLAALGILGQTRIHQMNALKVLLSLLINGIAAVYFIASGAILWSETVILGAGALAGGYAGPHLARRVGEKPVRVFVSVAGFAIALYFLLQG
ncbi:MAG: sulfite exporter TauE/SafE family protein [Acidobacteria bacterium]|nr:sulfite exporter TauE/SafE family protein [Acidobacteriota bacterium]